MANRFTYWYDIALEKLHTTYSDNNDNNNYKALETFFLLSATYSTYY